MLDIFGIALEDLDRDDSRFRRWCFARHRVIRSRRTHACLALNLAYYSPGSHAGQSAGSDAALFDAQRQWLLEQGLEGCRYAMRLSLKDAREPFLCYMLGNACIASGLYEEASSVMARCRRFSGVDFIWVMMGFAYAQIGDRRRALGCLRQIRDPRPNRCYRYAIIETLWLGLPVADKERYLALFPRPVSMRQSASLHDAACMLWSG